MTEPSRFSRAPAVTSAAAFVAGIASGAESVRGETEALALAGLCSLFLLARFSRGEAGGASRAAGALLFAALGFAEGRLRIAVPADTARRAFARLPDEPAERAQRVEGVLQDFWTGSPPRAHGRMQAERIWDEAALRWRPFPAEVFLFVSGEDSLAGAAAADRGDRVQAVGKLRPEGLPASDRDIALPWPSFRLSLKSALRLEKPEPTALALLASPNRWLFSRLPAAGSLGPEFERDVRGPLAALLLGRTSELDRGLVARYRRGGMYHLLVIAGLHVGLAAGIALILLRALSVRGRLRNGILLATVLLFVVVGGGNPPAARAGIVCGILFAAHLLERPIHAAQAIALSALVLFAASPAQLYSVGTMLTFAAVSGIAAFTQPLRNLVPARPAFLFSGFAAAVAAQVATSPILLWRFNVVSAGAWLTAPFSIPLAAGLIALGCLLLVLFAAGLAPAPLIALFAGGSRLLEGMAERAAGVAFLRPTPPLVWVVLVMTLLACGVLASRKTRICLLAAAAALFAFLALRPGPSGPARGFSLEALDVGQGDALLVRWRDRALLVDGGGPFDREARDFGRTHVLPKLLDRGVISLDAVLLTHPHPDHALGLFTILDELPVATLWRSSGQDEGGLSADLEAAAFRRGVPVRMLSTGERVRWRDAMLAVLHSGGPLTKKDGINNQSVVARFERDGRSALLTGDAGAAAEAQIARMFPSSRMRSDILKVGHHGSRGSTSATFLDAVAPRAALLSCGRENRFGHPAAETVASLSARNVRLFRTDLDSDVGFELLPGSTRVLRRGVR